MKKFKSIVAVLLSVGVWASGAAFTACSGDGDSGDCDVTITAGEQVANEAEWKQAFDNLINADSYTFKGNSDIDVDTSFTDMMSAEFECYFDLVNIRCLFNSNTSKEVDNKLISSSIVEYYEFNDSKAWTWRKENDESEACRILFNSLDLPSEETKRIMLASIYGNIDILGVFDSIINGQFFADENLTNDIYLKDAFSEFVYSDGIYYSNSLYRQGKQEIKVSIKNGDITGVQMKSPVIEYDQGANTVAGYGTFTYLISSVNSTTVTAPEGAKEAIDAAEAEAGKTN